MSELVGRKLGQATMANSTPVVIASDQSAIPVTGSFAAGSTFVQELLTPDPVVFHDPLVYFTVSSTAWRAINFDSGKLGTTSGSIFSQAPFAMFLNEAQTELWCIEGSTTATQVIQKITIATNVQSQLTTITGIDANEIIYVAGIHPITGVMYLGTRRQPEADGLMCLYTLNTTTAVATKLGDTPLFLSTATNGMSIFPDGKMWVWSAPSGAGTMSEINITGLAGTTLYTQASTTPANFENLSVTPRNTLLGDHSAGSGLSEMSTNFAFLRTRAIGGATLNANAMVAPISRKFYLGMLIIKQLEVDSTGAIVDTKYFLGSDGSDVTASIAAYSPGPFPFLAYTGLEANKAEIVQANSFPGTLAFGSVVTASFATLITPLSSYLPATTLKINNELNVPVYVTWDTATNDFYVGAGEIFVWDIPLSRTIINNVRVKAIGANAGSGNIYGSLIY